MAHLCSGIPLGPLTRRRVVRPIDDCSSPPSAYSLPLSAASAKPCRAVRIGAIGVHVSAWKRQRRHTSRKLKKEIVIPADNFVTNRRIMKNFGTENVLPQAVPAI
ncbi:hypothetical protein EVAR_72206_1 [Eumeta japonica]|uniref:Uncharacterized protein n=1 Tax=Eumeta variegata TaxID=151549 RepID=A0A4C1SMC3_EUMVA|nr:hypothetical protein EVAR_72206_1 [Eumeta japonica]